MIWKKLHNLYITEPLFSNNNITDVFQGFCISDFKYWIGIIIKNQVVIHKGSFGSLGTCKKSINGRLKKEVNNG